MKVSFPSFVPQQREVYLDQSDLNKIQEIMRQTLLFYAEYHDFKTSYSPSAFEVLIKELCEKYNVDTEERKERLPFIRSLVQALSEKDGQ